MTKVDAEGQLGFALFCCSLGMEGIPAQQDRW